MKISQADILFIIEKENDITNHWQNRWCEKFSTGRKLTLPNNETTAAEKCNTEIKKGNKPLIIVAHAQCCLWFLQTQQQKITEKIKAAFLVAPAIGSYEKNKLPFATVIIASNNDPLCPVDYAKNLAKNLGSLFVEGRENGHFNSASGHGPWPEGLMLFAEMMKKID